MSDQPPTRPKPGSLRDRIAAFENQAVSHAAPPPPRPKPGGLQQWKPKQQPIPTPISNDPATGSADLASTSDTSITSTSATPPASPHSHGTISTGTGGGGSMSAFDARQSIKQGGSLKERMAALQGKVAFGGGGGSSSSGGEPAVQKPKWKPTPPPPSQVPVIPAGEKDEKQEKQIKEEEEEEQEDAKKAEDSSGEPATTSPPPPSSSPPPPEVVDPEDEERQRRAAIAARMAKLGGARVGMMGPPLGRFAAKKSPPPQPPMSKQSRSETVESPPSAKEEEKEETEEEKCSVTGTVSETTSPQPMLSPPPQLVLSQSKSPPLSMPVPAVPRRTGPPRRKPPKSPVSSELPTPTPDAQVAAGGAEVVNAAITEAQEVLKGMEPLTKERRKVEVPPIEEIETMESVVTDTYEKHEPQQEEEEEEESKQTSYTHAVHEVEQSQIVEEPAELAEPLRDEGLEKEDEPTEEEPEAEDEEARRNRIADRLAKMGGVNPLFAAPPITKRSSSVHDEAVAPQSPPFRRLSTDSVSSAIIGSAARKSSVDSIKQVKLGAVKGGEGGISEKDEQVEEESSKKEEHVEEEEDVLDNGEEEDESNDVLTASMLLETPSRYNNAEEEEHEQDDHDTVPAPIPPRSVRGFSGIVTTRDLSDEEQHEHDEKETGGESPLPLPVSPRFASQMPKAVASLISQLTCADSEEQDGHHEDSAKPVPVPRRSLSLRSSVISTSSTYSQDEEEKKGVEEEEETEHVEKEDEEEREEEDKGLKHVPPPPTRRALLPPPPPPVEEQDTYTEPKQGHDEPLVIPPPTTERKHSKDDSDILGDLPLPHPILVRQSQVPTIKVEWPSQTEQKEVMDDEEGDPIDPSFHTPKRLSGLPFQFPSSSSAMRRSESQDEAREKSHEHDSNSSDLEAAKKKTIAERMAKLGGIRFGVAPMPGLPVRPPPPVPGAEGGEEVKGTEETKEGAENGEEEEEEEERARKERIAEKLAGMGGMRIGMMPPTRGVPLPRPAQKPQVPGIEVPISSSSAAPSTAPPARPPLTGSHDGEWEHDSATTPSEDGVKVEMEESEMEEVHHEDAKLDEEEFEHEDGEIVSPPPLPPPRASAPQRYPSLSSSSTPQPLQGVRPPIPSTANLTKRSSLSGSTMAASAPQRHPSLSSSSTPQPLQGVRPPIPSTANLTKRSSLSGSTMAASASLERKGSSGSTGTTTASYRSTVVKGQSDYVMVEEPQVDSSIEEEVSSLPPPPPPPTRLPPQRVTAPSHAPPAPAISDSIISQWELPSIPSGSLEGVGFGLAKGKGTDPDLSLSWTDAMDERTSRPVMAAPSGSHFHRYPPTHPPPPVPPSTLAPSHGPVPVPPPVDLSADDLIAIWGRVGVQVCETATTMYEKSKKMLVGDGTYAGFVHGVLNEVPNAVKPAVYVAEGGSHNNRASVPWGYVVYAQNGSVVQRRMSEILPGDVVEMVDARFKGHKGLQTYTLQVGAAEKEIFVGVVAEHDIKKSKLKVLQANQHVGQQTVELVTYRLEDLKSGTLKIYRVLEA